MSRKMFSSFRTINLVFIILVLFVTFALPAGSIQALNIESQQTSSATYTLKDFNYTTDQEFLGVVVDREFNIALPINWDFNDDALITIRFSHSSALNPISSMSVEWNDQRVGSTLLTAENTQNGSLQIALSPEIINPGYNVLKVKFFMGISEDFCIDFDNPAVWAVVHNTSSLQFSYQEVTAKPELASAPEIFIDSSFIATNDITMIIPDQLDLPTLNSVAVMATTFGQRANWRNTAINVMTLTEASQNPPLGNLVILATIDQITSFDTRLTPVITSALENYTDSGGNRPPLSENDGIITFDISPFDPTAHVLCLTGTITEAIEKCARAAAMEEFYEQSEGQWAIVRTVPEPKSHPTVNKLSISMQDLGLDDTTAYGTSEQTIQFNIPLSALWTVDSEAWLTLHFSHSQLLNADRSTLNVMVNGIPVTSIQLSSKTADDTYQEVRIPLRFLNIGTNTIAIETNMEYRDSREQIKLFCTDDTYPRAWLTLYADTAIIFPESPQDVTLNINNFPYGFADPFSFENFAFVMPESDQNRCVNTLADLALTIGKSLEGDPSDIKVLYNRDRENDYQLSIGTISVLLSDTINNALPLPINTSTGLPQPNELVLDLDTQSGIRSYIQTFKEGNQINLIVTAMTPEGLLAAGKLLSNSFTRAGLDGTVAVVSDFENASAYRIESEGSESQTGTVNDQTSIVNVQGQSVWIVRISIGIAVISLIGLIMALVWKNKQSRET